MGLLERIKSLLSNPQVAGSFGYDDSVCTHEGQNLCPTEDHNIWHVKDSYLEGESYWTATDAAFTKCRTRVKEYKCFGCGEERTISTGEIIEVRWKEDMNTEEIAEFHEKAKTGSWYNGQMWWEDTVWDGDPGEVAPPLAWQVDIGYTAWKENTEQLSDTETIKPNNDD